MLEKSFENRYANVTVTPVGYIGGYFTEFPDGASDEDIQRAKDKVVDEICEEIRRVARENEDFFIIHRSVPGDVLRSKNTVGAKFVLPTVKENNRI